MPRRLPRPVISAFGASSSPSTASCWPSRSPVSRRPARQIDGYSGSPCATTPSTVDPRSTRSPSIDALRASSERANRQRSNTTLASRRHSSSTTRPMNSTSRTRTGPLAPSSWKFTSPVTRRFSTQAAGDSALVAAARRNCARNSAAATSARGLSRSSKRMPRASSRSTWYCSSAGSAATSGSSPSMRIWAAWFGSQEISNSALKIVLS